VFFDDRRERLLKLIEAAMGKSVVREDVVSSHRPARLAFCIWRMCLLLRCSILVRQPVPNYRPSKPDIPPDWRWRVPMKTFLCRPCPTGLGVATVPPFAHSTVADDAEATRYQQARTP